MGNQSLSDHVDAMLQKHRQDTLKFAASFGEKHDALAYKYLMERVPQSGQPIKNDTSSNLKKKAAEPGAFFNKCMRPIPLGSK